MYSTLKVTNKKRYVIQMVFQFSGNEKVIVKIVLDTVQVYQEGDITTTTKSSNFFLRMVTEQYIQPPQSIWRNDGKNFAMYNVREMNKNAGRVPI